MNRGALLSPVDQTELVQRIAHGTFEARIVEIVGLARRSALLRVMLAGLECRGVVTTNYDLLYEAAVEATERQIASVVPRAPAQEADRWG